MIVAKTPMRVSLFGGGSDFPSHFREHGGAVLGMAIDKYVYTLVRRLPPFFWYRHRVVYSKIELAADVKDIEHPLVRAILKEADLNHGVDIHHVGELSHKSGMGSSSAFAVGLLQALAAHKGEMMTKRQLADGAIRIERDVIREAGGWQDQIWSAFGGFNLIRFSAEGYDVSPVILPRARLNEIVSSIVLYATGLEREASIVEATKEYDHNDTTLVAMTEMVDEASMILASPSWSLRDLGLLLNAGWSLKKRLSPEVSSPKIDAIYEAGIGAGAWGGKLLGAGAGGFMLFMCPYERRAALRAAMDGRIEVNVDVDYDGSKVVMYHPNGL